MSALEPSVAHAAAIADTAETNLETLDADVTVYRDVVPDVPRFPYAVFWGAPAAPLAAGERMAGWGGDVITTTQATVAGLSPADVLGACDRLTAALHRRKPQLADRVTGDFDQDGVPGRPQPDTVRSPDGHQVWVAFLFFTLQSSPKRSTP